MRAKRLMQSMMIAGGLGLLTSPMAATAADPMQWLQRQFSTTHRAPVAQAEAPAHVGARPHASLADDGHAFARRWLERQMSSTYQEAPGQAAQGGVAVNEGSAEASDTDYALRWLHRQISTEHRELRS